MDHITGSGTDLGMRGRCFPHCVDPFRKRPLYFL